MTDEEFLAEIERRSKTFMYVFMSGSENYQLEGLCPRVPTHWYSTMVNPTLSPEHWRYMLSSSDARCALRNREIALAAIVADTLTK